MLTFELPELSNAGEEPEPLAAQQVDIRSRPSFNRTPIGWVCSEDSSLIHTDMEAKAPFDGETDDLWSRLHPRSTHTHEACLQHKQLETHIKWNSLCTWRMHFHLFVDTKRTDWRRPVVKTEKILLVRAAEKNTMTWRKFLLS